MFDGSQQELFADTVPHSNRFVEPDQKQTKRARDSQLQSMAARSDPQTSHDAAKSMMPYLAGQHAQVMQAFAQYEARFDGLTASQVSEITGIEKPSCSKRIGELASTERKGRPDWVQRLYATDRTRRTNKGRQGTIYKTLDLTYTNS